RMLLVAERARGHAVDLGGAREATGKSGFFAQLAHRGVEWRLARLHLAARRQPDAEARVTDQQRASGVARIDGDGKGAAHQTCTTPPSRSRQRPTCVVFAGFASQAMPCATSSGAKKRFTGTTDSACARNSASEMPSARAAAATPWSAMSVSTQPGAQQLTKIPRGMSSSASALQRPMTPCLAAQ